MMTIAGGERVYHRGQDPQLHHPALVLPGPGLVGHRERQGEELQLLAYLPAVVQLGEALAAADLAQALAVGLRDRDHDRDRKLHAKSDEQACLPLQQHGHGQGHELYHDPYLLIYHHQGQALPQSGCGSRCHLPRLSKSL